MKEYVYDLINGGVYIDVQTHSQSIGRIFGADDWVSVVPFEGNYGDVYEEASDYITESFFESQEGMDEYHLQIDDLPNEDGQLAVLRCPNGDVLYYYSENSFDESSDDYFQFGDKIGQILSDLSQNGIQILHWIGSAALLPTIYKLTDGWVIVFSEVVYGKHPNHIGVIAKTRKRANQIMKSLFLRLRETPISDMSRRELFHDIKTKEEYNESNEANMLRYQYLKKIKQAYEKFDFSDLFDDLAEDCIWGGCHNKNDVIESLIASAKSMKQRNYRHECSIVQVGKEIAPLECNTKPDGTGDRIQLGLLYNKGEFCLIDNTPVQSLFFRMTIAPNGKIKDYYATIPSGEYHIVESPNEEFETNEQEEDTVSETYTVIDNYSKYEFSWREWTAPMFSSAAALRKHLDSLNLIGRKIKELRMIGLSYMHTRDWVEESAYSHYHQTIEDEDELQRMSNYEDIDPELLFDRYAQIDEPLLIQFEDGDRLEIICPVEGKVQVSVNHIPWWIDAGTNSPNEDANVLFSDCIGQVISGVEVHSHEWMTDKESEDGRVSTVTLVPNDECDSAYEVILRFENGCGLSLMGECYDYCAVYSIGRNNKANQIPFGELREGLFNWEDLCIDPVTGFEASTNGFHFGKKGQDHTDEPFMTLCPSGVDTAMYVSEDDFLLFAMSIMCIKRDWFDEYGEYKFDFDNWQEVLRTAQKMLDYGSFDDLFDYMMGLNIIDHRGVNIPLRMLNSQGALFWNYREDFVKQLKDMREWTALTMKENDTMNIYGF